MAAPPTEEAWRLAEDVARLERVVAALAAALERRELEVQTLRVQLDLVIQGRRYPEGP